MELTFFLSFFSLSSSTPSPVPLSFSSVLSSESTVVVYFFEGSMVVLVLPSKDFVNKYVVIDQSV